MPRISSTQIELAEDFARLQSRLDRMERKLDLILGHLGLQSNEPSKLVKELLKSGKVLQAVKAYKEQAGITMDEAEMRIEAMREVGVSHGRAKRSS